MSTDKPAVVVVGSLNHDVLLDVAAFPAPGETVTATGSSTAWGGKGANQAVAAARLGARVCFVGAVGDDPFGTEALADLDSYGVDTTHVVRSDDPTGSAYVLREPSGENLIVVASGANHALTSDDVLSALRALPAGETFVVASCEIPLEAVQAAARVATERSWPFVLNPAPARPLPRDLLAAVTVLTPNATEVTSLGATSVAALLDTGVGAVVVTRGADGAEIHSHAGVRSLPACRADVVDTVGAGDAFTAALAVALASHVSLPDAARFAIAAGAVAVTGPGARGADLSPSSVRAVMSAAGGKGLRGQTGEPVRGT